MEDNHKFECRTWASDLLSDLKQVIRVQRWIIVALAAFAAVLVAYRKDSYERQASGQKQKLD